MTTGGGRGEGGGAGIGFSRVSAATEKLHVYCAPFYVVYYAFLFGEGTVLPPPLEGRVVNGQIT